MTNELEFARDQVTYLQIAIAEFNQTGVMRRSYSIAGRAMEFRDISDARKELQFWTGEMRRLEAAADIAAGIQPSGRLAARF